MAQVKMTREDCVKLQILRSLSQIANHSQELECQATDPEHPLNRYGDVRAALTLAGSHGGRMAERLSLELEGRGIEIADTCWHCETAEERYAKSGENRDLEADHICGCGQDDNDD